ncbi:MAG: glycosyltransferase family 2 protein [Rhodospirillaceae bacterium]
MPFPIPYMYCPAAPRGFSPQPCAAVPGPTLSVVIPFYNEGEGTDALFARLLPILDKLGVTWEVICVNDGSRDDTLARLLKINHLHSNVRVVELSRNFGKELALSAGLSYACGDAVVPMDADLQHPPELLGPLLGKWQEGFDMVIAVRDHRTGQSLGHRIFARIFYWLFEHMSDVKLPREAGDFRLMDRKVVDVINRMPERTRFMKGIFAWIGFRQASIPYHQGERVAGESRWGFLKLIHLSIDGLTAFSVFPLRVWGLIGAIVSLLSVMYGSYRVLRTLVYGADVPGFESLIVAITFLGGVQLLILGIIGDYLGRVYNEVKGRPLFIVRAAYGWDNQNEMEALPFQLPPNGKG